MVILAFMAISKVSAEEIYFSPAKFSQSIRSNILVNKEPAPIYEPNAETEVQSGIQQPIYFKPLNVPFSSARKYDATPNSITSSQSVHRPNYNALYSQPPVLLFKIPNKIKALQPAYTNTHTIQNQAVKTTITHSETPVVSHTTFTGLGTTYSW
ncbi:unnamed protein product, partial [Brenthis ino]